jgi:hypothetical protein
VNSVTETSWSSVSSSVNSDAHPSSSVPDGLSLSVSPTSSDEVDRFG